MKPTLRTSLVFAFLFSGLVHASTPMSTPREDLERILFENPDANVRTDAFLLLKDGKPLYERYARGYGPGTKHLSWSVAKTISGIVVANLIDRGILSMDDPLDRWIPNYRGSARLVDAYRMSSGIDFLEEYSGIPVNSDVARMLYLDGPKRGFGDYAVSLRNRADAVPGHHFYYSTGDAVLIQEAAKGAVGNRAAYDETPWTTFFDRLGIRDATFEQDSAGTFAGGSYAYLTAPDYARIGQLIVNGGVWNGDRIIPEWYFGAMNTVAPGVLERPLKEADAHRAYSMQVTTNLPIPSRDLSSEYPDLPTDALLLIGHQGQLIVAMPSEGIVLVRLATDHDDDFNPYRQSFFNAVRRFVAQATGVEPRAAGGLRTRIPAAPPLATSATPPLDYLKVPKLIRAVYAKELCSCRFVVGRTRAQCRDDLKVMVPVFPIARVDDAKRTVTTTFTALARSHAVYLGPKLGCTLID